MNIEKEKRETARVEGGRRKLENYIKGEVKWWLHEKVGMVES